MSDKLKLLAQYEAAGCPLARELRVLRGMCSCRNDDASVDEAEDEYLRLRSQESRPAPKGEGVGVGDVELIEAALVDSSDAWTDEDAQKPWGCEIAFLRHLSNDPAMGVEKGAMLRHCANRIEATATPSPPAESGWRWVPEVPTNKMQVDGLSALDESNASESGIGSKIGFKAIRELWAAMLSAAPAREV